MDDARHEAADPAGARRLADDEEVDPRLLRELTDGSSHVLGLAGDDGRAEGDRELDDLAQLAMLLAGDVPRMLALLAHVEGEPARVHASGDARCSQDEGPGDRDI